MTNSLEKIEQNNLLVLKSMMRQDKIKKRFEEVLCEQAPTFMASIVNAVNNNSSLQKCEPMTIWSAGMIAASLKLPVDQNLGFAYIVPYYDKNKGVSNAQFQMGYKGFVQLAIRSGQYKRMNVSEVYQDELKVYNPITGEVEFNPVEEWLMRSNGKVNEIAGYYACFELTNGFFKEVFWTKAEIEQHAKRYSQTYKKGYGRWKEDFAAMAKKTVIKNLLSKWGILSVEMQKAIKSDQATFPDINKEDDPQYPDNPTDPEVAHEPESPLEKKIKEKNKDDEAKTPIEELAEGDNNDTDTK